MNFTKLQVAQPEEMGMKSEVLNQELTELLGANKTGAASLFVNGKLVWEHYWKDFGPQSRFDIYSAGKAFTATAIGLLAIGLYALYFSNKSFGAKAISELDVKGIGIFVTASGLYYVGVYAMWIVFGSVGGWSTWYAWFLGHNLELRAMSLPLIGVPLLFQKNQVSSRLR